MSSMSIQLLSVHHKSSITLFLESLEMLIPINHVILGNVIIEYLIGRNLRAFSIQNTGAYSKCLLN